MQPFQLPKLDTRFFKDPASRPYGIRPLLPAVTVQRKTIWAPPKGSLLPLDQGSEGACVGFGWSGELQVPPIEIPVHNQFAQNFYLGARDADRKDGRFFAEGATVLAGAKYARRRGWISEYRWCFGMEDLIDTLCTKGPVVLGIPWYAGMYQTDIDGRIRVNGELAGGHCILAIGWWPNHPIFGNCVVLLNSWGKGWGINGIGYLPEAEARRLLITEQGEMCVAADIAPKPVVPWWIRVINSFR